MPIAVPTHELRPPNLRPYLWNANTSVNRYARTHTAPIERLVFLYHVHKSTQNPLIDHVNVRSVAQLSPNNLRDRLLRNSFHSCTVRGSKWYVTLSIHSTIIVVMMASKCMAWIYVQEVSQVNACTCSSTQTQLYYSPPHLPLYLAGPPMWATCQINYFNHSEGRNSHYYLANIIMHFKNMNTYASLHKCYLVPYQPHKVTYTRLQNAVDTLYQVNAR